MGRKQGWGLMYTRQQLCTPVPEQLSCGGGSPTARLSLSDLQGRLASDVGDVANAIST